ncbi:MULTISPECIES: hypothetical protein [Pseudoalteromonas]|uniref:DUF1570 domain-containing protein n=1 Tax=Pseudoalteromonas amylolytica TaxID=1859457 RepID=A0A1S1N0K4_9GAMM|nr:MULTISPECIES: hypothetical protein [Pseudoalteromonas]OHU88126.1 hypothetical protein BFC16_12105 [Pseudoalteromonas sp. JW3]OHU91566.1 hypothetical protein BET10_12225 [Pseudoalteromonas amylolytica]
MRTILLFCALILNGCAQTHSPSEPKHNTVNLDSLDVDITVVGRTSTLNHIDIAFLGKTIPNTYSNGKITNSRGYNWWASKHFALKSDLPEDKVRLYLELLEMSYPHYVELFSMAPDNIDKQRIAVVYGSSRTRVQEAMLDDGFLRGVHDNAGGETMFYNRAGYNFPSHRQHHQRYIVIHETMHAFHMALNGHSTWAPNWITEGLADSIASHVYDPEKKQLTVMVFDRAPMNYITTGLEQYAQGDSPTIEQINDDPALKRGLNFFIIHFLMNDPMRQLQFKRYLKELMQLNPHSDQTLPVANKLLKTVFSDWQQLEHEFAQFVASIKPTFDIVSGPWEQNGNAYWLRSDNAQVMHQLNIFPAAQAQHPMMDFPKPELPRALRDNDWDLAAKIDFEPAQLKRGEVGLSIYGGERVAVLTLIDGVRFKLDLEGSKQVQQLAMTPALHEDIKTGSHLALSVQQQAGELIVKLSTQTQTQNMIFALPEGFIVNSNKMSLLGKGMNHKVTPYIKAHTFELPKLAANNANPWYFSDADDLLALVERCAQFKAVIKDCEQTLADTVPKVSDQQQHPQLKKDIQRLLTHWNSQLPSYTSTPTDSNVSIATKSFDGVYLKVSHEDTLTINISGPYSGSTQGTLDVSFYSFQRVAQSQQLWSENIEIAPYETKLWQPNIEHLTTLKQGLLMISAVMEVDGEPIKLQKSIVL